MLQQPKQHQKRRRTRETLWRPPGKPVLEATSGLDEEVQRVKDAATAAQESSQVAKESAVAAQTAATTAQTGATTAQQAAQTAQNAQQAAQSSAKTAQAASDAAANAKNAIANMTVNAVTLPEGSEATVTKTEQGGGFNLQYGIPRGDTGQKGDQGAMGPQVQLPGRRRLGPTGPGGPQGVTGERGPRGRQDLQAARPNRARDHRAYRVNGARKVRQDPRGRRGQEALTGLRLPQTAHTHSMWTRMATWFCTTRARLRRTLRFWKTACWY